MSRIALLGIAFLLFAGCGPAGGGRGGSVVAGPTGGGPGGGTGGGGEDGGVLSFTLRKVQDPGSNNVVAYVYWSPLGWTNEDSIQWVQAGTPYALASLITRSPDKEFSLGYIPMIAGTYSEGPMGNQGVMMKNASDAIDKIGKNSKVTNWTVVGEQSAPVESGYQQVGGNNSSADVCVKQVSFTEDGVDKDAYFVAKLDQTVISGVTSSQLWTLSLQVLSAPRGRLGETVFVRQAGVFFASASITPEYNQLINKITWDASQINRKAALQQGDDILDQYWKRQGQGEKQRKDFQNYIRGRQDFTGPDGKVHNLPAGQTYWMDDKGTMQQSPDPNFNPPGGQLFKPA